MLKKYSYQGKIWQFEEGRQPAGAVEIGNRETVNQPEPETKPRKVQTKPRKAGTK